MQSTGNKIDALMAVTDVFLAVHGTRKSEPWEIIAHARTHISDQMGEFETTADLMDAYRDLHWLQMRLMLNLTNQCHFEIVSRNEQEAWLCRNPTLAFCTGCGIELCSNHLAYVDGKAVCLGCEMF